MSIKDDFAQRFTLLRSVYKFTYKDLGNALGLNANTITEWAVSKRNFPNPDKLVLVANLYSQISNKTVNNVSCGILYGYNSDKEIYYLMDGSEIRFPYRIYFEDDDNAYLCFYAFFSLHIRGISCIKNGADWFSAIFFTQRVQHC